MRKLNVVSVPAQTAEKGLQAIAQFLNLNDKEHINNLLWNKVEAIPDIEFSIAYNKESLFLKFYVSERYTKADYTEINDPVFKDSCVELFIAFDNDASYYNLEFNSIGTAQVGYGPGRQDRVNLSPEVIRAIKHISRQDVDGNADLPFTWELVLEVPLRVFIHHPGLALVKTLCKGNFYKCGDGLPEPHFLAWNAIESREPDFHQPAFFGEICFL